MQSVPATLSYVCVRAWCVIINLAVYACLSGLQRFYGGPDESFFYLITAEIEACGGSALEHIWVLQQHAHAVLNDGISKVCALILL